MLLHRRHSPAELHLCEKMVRIVWVYEYNKLKCFKKLLYLLAEAEKNLYVFLLIIIIVPDNLK